MKNSVLLDESFKMSVNSINMYKYLISKEEYVTSKQFLISSTSIGAILRESNFAEDRSEFMHKLSIALKECYETLYWLELIKYSEKDKTKEIDALTSQCNNILRMITASIKTCKNNLIND